ncbi:hypothetical protein BJF96_g1976 [Verticillium dahliae]|uniref:Azaphilone pigments biosynthesis cluster protein L N-terminal domain-containing protein n=1 Tax=Verticillium dahliae TaxID=27337 RepID=A0AA45AQE3_VERDA|nr:hypothetical protein BJF96_g1976 [Verticillium dahliae]
MEVTTGVAGLVIFAIDAAFKLTNLVNEIRDAPDDIRDLGSNLISLATILNSTKTLCSLDEFKDVDELLSETLMSCVKQCEDASSGLYAELSAFKPRTPTTPGVVERRSLRQMMHWSWRQKSRQALKTRLFDSRDNLNMAVTVLNGTVAGKGYHAIRMDIAELNMKLNRGASPASRATRQRFRDKLEDDLRSVTSDGQIVSVAGRTDVSFGIRNYFDRLEIATIPAAPPPIDAFPEQANSAVDTEEAVGNGSARAPKTLLEAVTSGDRAAVEYVLSQDAGLNRRSPEGQTVLHICVSYDDRETADILIKHEPSIINRKNSRSETPFQFALREQSWNVAGLLIERGCSMGQFATEFFTWLPQHVTDLDSGLNPDYPEADTGLRPIQVAVLLEQREHAKLLIEHGAALNRFIPATIATDKIHPQHERKYHDRCRALLYDASLLQMSILFNKDDTPAMMQLLLDNGEDPDSKEGGTANLLTHLYLESQWVYAQAIIRAGGDVNGRGPDGSTTMHWAAYANNTPLIKMLREYGADVNPGHPGKDDSTPLMLAVRHRARAAVMALLDAGANARMTDVWGVTALGNAEYLKSDPEWATALSALREATMPSAKKKPLFVSVSEERETSKQKG